MIQLQNALYKRARLWNNQLQPKSAWGDNPQSLRDYWGWNEVPLKRSVLVDPKSWDTVVIKLPGAACYGKGHLDSISCLPSSVHAVLQVDISKWVQSGFLVPGVDNQFVKPGSSVLFARESIDDNHAWYTQFFCEAWDSPDKMWQVVSVSGGSSTQGGCYVQAPSKTLDELAV